MIPSRGAGTGYAPAEYEKAPFQPVGARGRLIPPSGAGTGHARTYFEDASFQPDDYASSGMIPQGGADTEQATYYTWDAPPQTDADAWSGMAHQGGAGTGQAPNYFEDTLPRPDGARSGMMPPGGASTGRAPPSLPRNRNRQLHWRRAADQSDYNARSDSGYPDDARRLSDTWHHLSPQERELATLRARNNAADVEIQLAKERARQARLLTANEHPTPNPAPNSWRGGGESHRSLANIGQAGSGGTSARGARLHDVRRTPAEVLSSAQSSLGFHVQRIANIDPLTLSPEETETRMILLSGHKALAPSAGTSTAAAPAVNRAVNLAATAPEAAKAKVPKKGKTATEVSEAAARAAQTALDNAAALADAVLEFADDEDSEEDVGDVGVVEEALTRQAYKYLTAADLSPAKKRQLGKHVAIKLLEYKTKDGAAIAAVTAAAVATTATDAGAGAGTTATATTAPAPLPAPAPAATGKRPSPKRGRQST